MDYSKLFTQSEKIKALFLYILLICLIYSQVVFFGKSLLPTLYYPKPFCVSEEEGRRPVNTFNIDLGTPAFYEMPINKFVGDMYREGHLPLWNPYQGIGSPLAAQYSTRTFFPYQILEDISPYRLWDYFMLARLIIAAFFTYLFLRLLGISSPCSFLGGIFYSLCGSFTWFINLEQYTNVAMMVPVCLFSLERLIRFKKARHIAECAIVFALMLLAGQPEIAIYVMVLLAAYYIFRVIVEKRGALTFLKAGFKLCGMILLCLGISALLILPFLEFIPNAYQCHPLGGDMGTREPTGLRVAVTILIPSFFDLPTYYRFFPHNGVWDWVGGYTGILVLFLIMLGFFSKTKYRAFFLFFSLFGFFIVLKNFGSPLAAWIGKLPLLDQSWSPRWSGPVWTFSLACAAAVGLEMASNVSLSKKTLIGVSTSLIILVVLLSCETTFLSQFRGLNSDQLKMVLPPIFGGMLIGILSIVTAAILFLYARGTKGLMYAIISLAIFELWVSVPKGANFPWTIFELIPFLLGIPVVYLLARGKRRSGIAGIILIVLFFTFIDVKSPHGFPDRKNLFKEPGFVTFLKKNAGHSRVVAGNGIFMPNFSSSFKIYDIRYINSLSPAYYQNYVNRHLLKEPHVLFSDKLWFAGVPDSFKQKPRSIYEDINDNFLYYSYIGTKYIITSKDTDFKLPLVYDEDVKIYENPHAFPRVYIAHNVKMASGFQDAQERMKAQDVNIRYTAILERQPPAWYKSPSVIPAASRAQIEEYSPNRVKIGANLKFDGILVLTDVFYPGWKAYVDNKESEIRRINGLVRGIFLEKGAHDIIFKYEPFSFRIGLPISFVSFLICLVLIFRKDKK